VDHPHCDDQDHPRLVVQNLTFIDGDARARTTAAAPSSSAAAASRPSTPASSTTCCADDGPTSAAGRSACSTSTWTSRSTSSRAPSAAPPRVGNVCANGGGLSSIGVSYTVLNSLFSHNHAIGNGANPAQPGTPGGGSGGAIYNDGNTFFLSLCGVRIEHNDANEGGGAIFFVSNDRSGDIRIDRSVITNNVGGSWYPTYPQISGHDDTPIAVTDSTIEE
jgi:hypothetical protein